MHEVCCKLEKNKVDVWKGEVCNKFDDCEYNQICGAKKLTQKNQYGGTIIGKNTSNKESKELRKALNELENNRVHRRK